MSAKQSQHLQITLQKKIFKTNLASFPCCLILKSNFCTATNNSGR